MACTVDPTAGPFSWNKKRDTFSSAYLRGPCAPATKYVQTSQKKKSDETTTTQEKRLQFEPSRLSSAPLVLTRLDLEFSHLYNTIKIFLSSHLLFCVRRS
jgi:hypothetical protein